MKPVAKGSLCGARCCAFSIYTELETQAPVVGAQPRLGRVVVAQLAPCVWPQRSSPIGVWRGSDDPDSHKWVQNVGNSHFVARNVSPTHASFLPTFDLPTLPNVDVVVTS